MATIVKVEPEQMSAMATRFSGRADEIQKMMGLFTANMALIQNVAFLGHVGDAAIAKFKAEFEPRMTVLKAKLTEISDDLQLTVADYIAEDEDVATFFGGGGGGANAL